MPAVARSRRERAGAGATARGRRTMTATTTAATVPDVRVRRACTSKASRGCGRSASSPCSCHLGFITGTTFGNTWRVNLGPISTRPAWLLGHLEFAVAIFLMISAFLLYRPFVMSAFVGTPAPGSRRFLQRRIFRLFPAYWATVALLWLLGWIHIDGVLHTFRVLTLTQIYTQKSFFAIDILVPTWTLATEFSFYIFLVGWAPLMRPCRRGRAEGSSYARACRRSDACGVRVFSRSRVPRCLWPAAGGRALAPGACLTCSPWASPSPRSTPTPARRATRRGSALTCRRCMRGDRGGLVPRGAAVPPRKHRSHVLHGLETRHRP